MKIDSLVFITSLFLGAQDAQGPPPALVEVESALQDQVAATTWVPGTVVSRNDAQIAAEVSGRATWVAEVGDVIEEGEPLAAIDDQALQLQLQNNAAAIKRLEAQLAFEISQVERFERLANTNNTAANQLDQSRSTRDMVEQDLASAKINRSQIQYNLARTQVIAPFGGHVVERLIQPGEYLNPGSPVARLVDTTHKEVRAQAPLSSTRFVQAGMLVTVQDQFSEAKNSVRTVIPVGDERSRLVEIRIGLEQTDWVIGGPVRVALPSSDTRSLVAIPRDALVLRGNETFVYRVDADDKAERVTVETGIGLGSLVEVIGDIEPGDRLVVRGGERLRAGQPLTIVESASG